MAGYQNAPICAFAGGPAGAAPAHLRGAYPTKKPGERSTPLNKMGVTIRPARSGFAPVTGETHHV